MLSKIMDGYHWLCMVIDCYGLLLNVVDFFCVFIDGYCLISIVIKY